MVRKGPRGPWTPPRCGAQAEISVRTHRGTQGSLMLGWEVSQSGGRGWAKWPSRRTGGQMPRLRPEWEPSSVGTPKKDRQGFPSAESHCAMTTRAQIMPSGLSKPLQG